MDTIVPEEYLYYRGEDTKPEDLDSFWDQLRHEVIEQKVSYKLEETSYAYSGKVVFRLMIKAVDNTTLVGWYIRAKTPQSHCLITTHGYRSSKQEPHAYLFWVDSGVDVIAIDMRLQGGETGNNTPLSGPLSEVIALNILDLKKSYLKLIHQDMLLTTQLTKDLGYKGYILEGTSQAGGLAIATASIMQNATAVLANVPSNSDLDQRVAKTSGSFRAFQLLANRDPETYEKVMHHLSYFDTKNMAERLQSPLFASVGGQDNVCPAKAFFATYNRVQSTKSIIYYPFSGHEGGGGKHTELEVKYLQQILKRS